MFSKPRRVLKSVISGADLRARIFRGGMWLGAGGSIDQGLRLVRNIVLVRLLAPEHFGITAIVFAVNHFLMSFQEIGIREAVIQNPRGEETTYLNGAWWLSVARSSVIFVIAFFCAPLIAGYYDDPDLVPMMRLVFLSIVLNGALSAKAYVAVKRMQYSKWVVLSQGGGIIGVLATIGLAFVMRSVEALIIGFVIEAAARCLLSFIVCPFVPRFRFEKEHLTALFRYARGMFGLSILLTLYTQIDIFVLGKLVTKNALGLYKMAGSLAQAPGMLIGIFIRPLLMPAFSSMQSDNTRLNRSIQNSTSLFSLFGFPVLIMCACYGREILGIVYSDEYVPVAIPFALLFADSLLRSCSAPLTTAYLAKGEPHLHRVFVVFRAVLIMIIIYPAVKRFGLIGAACARLISLLLAYCLQVLRMNRLTGITMTQYARGFLRAILNSSPVFILWALTHGFVSNPWHNIAIGLFGCLIAYALSAPFVIRLIRDTSPGRRPVGEKPMTSSGA